MRNKIIAVNAVIVLIVGLLSYVLMRNTIVAAASNMEQLLADAKHDAQGATARIQLDGLRAERWLAAKASEPGMSDPLAKASPSARGDAATAQADSVMTAAKGATAFEGRIPSVVELVDANGKIVGRNGSNLSRGDDLAAIYPALKTALTSGQSGSDIWFNKERNDNYLAAFAPLRDDAGKVAGAIVIGTSLNDVLSRASDATTGRGLALAVPSTGGAWQVVARSGNATNAFVDAVTTTANDTIKQSAVSGHALAIRAGDAIAASAPLEGIGDGKRVALIAEAPASRIANADTLPNPIFGVAALGVLLVVVGGWLLGNYIDRPINMLEEGLLAILNGQSDKRFELEHAELGGLAFRIDQLLNQLMGVEEDTTDEEGRPSKAPTAADYRDAMSVDAGGRPASGGAEGELDAAAVGRLAGEPGDAYYTRIYGEYIAAKKVFGEQTDHISRDAFVTRIQGMEREAAQKYGKPVRYQVKATGKEVILIAVPLP